MQMDQDAAVDDAPARAATVPHLERGNERLRAPRDVRDLVQQRRLAAASPARTLAQLAVVAALYLGSLVVGVAVGAWWCWALVWALQAFLLLACGAVMHEGVHGNVTGDRRVDRVLAFIAGWLIFLPAAGYRPYHLQHHATTMSEEDPSGANAKPFKHRREYLLVMLLAGPGFTAQMWSISLRTIVGRPPAYVSERFRRQIVAETLIALALYAAVAVAAPLLGVGQLVLVGWVVPAVIGLCAVAPYILMPEHYGAPLDRTILESTATVRSNPVLSFVYLNNNHHTAHHLMSSCNPLRLGEITDLLGDRVELRYRSYAAFHRDVFRSLSW